MVYVYKTKGVCSREMTVDVDENGIIRGAVSSRAAAPATCWVSPGS